MTHLLSDLSLKKNRSETYFYKQCFWLETSPQFWYLVCYTFNLCTVKTAYSENLPQSETYPDEFKNAFILQKAKIENQESLLAINQMQPNKVS